MAHNIDPEALRTLADEYQTDMARAFGGDAAWLTTGTHVANLVAEWLNETAGEIEAAA